jgi:pimeloyl-ACP methyl ester carboxylesterase
LPGSRAYFGELNAGVYRIEIPDAWNHRLVVYMRGSQMYEDEISAEAPRLREYLIANGYAWASTSYDTSLEIYGAAADQAAALWDHFAKRFGRPEMTLAVGASMGGGAALISAERYPDRYQGALSACGVAGSTPHHAQFADLLVAGSFAAGLTNTKFNHQFVADSVRQDIRPVLDSNAASRDLFERLWVSLSGGGRPFAIEGFELREDAMWASSEDAVVGQLTDNSTKEYVLDDSLGIDDDEFNAAAVRITPHDGVQIPPGEDITGDIQVPVLILHTTGDGIVTLSQVQYVQEMVWRAENEDLLSVQLVPSPVHCGYEISDYARAFDALVDWVESGEKPGCVVSLGGDADQRAARELAGC